MDLRQPHPCERCGAQIENPNQRGKPQRFCSVRCKDARPPTIREFICSVCSRKWEAPSPTGRPPAYCSDICRKDAAKARAREWYHSNPERVAEQPSRGAQQKATYNAAYYEANSERENARAVEYARTHPEWKRAKDAARYAMTRGAAESERFTLDEIIVRDKGVCYLCGKDAVSPTMDHVIPVVLGGPHTRANVRLACRSCNSRKRHKLLPEGCFEDGSPED